MDWLAKVLELGQLKFDAGLFEDAVDEFFCVHFLDYFRVISDYLRAGNYIVRFDKSDGLRETFPEDIYVVRLPLIIETERS